MAKLSPRAVSLAPGLNEPALSPGRKTFPFAKVSPDKAVGLMDHDLEELQRDLDTLAADLLVFDDPDPKALKRWLKAQKYRALRSDFDGMPF